MVSQHKRMYRAFVAVGACWMAGSAVADMRLEEVIVTSRRVEENIQSLPLSVTAMTPTELQEQHVVDISNLAQSTPNMFVNNGATNPNTPIVQIRGQVALDSNLINQNWPRFIRGQPFLA
ncbi:MAG: hypothetical protein ABW049_05405 [Spongiibacteraceae bacterium]